MSKKRKTKKSTHNNLSAISHPKKEKKKKKSKQIHHAQESKIKKESKIYIYIYILKKTKKKKREKKLLIGPIKGGKAAILVIDCNYFSPLHFLPKLER